MSVWQTYYDFEPYGWLDSNFIIHPEHFFMAARIGKDGLWRITYGEKPGLSTEQLRERLPTKFKTFLPGHPEPDQYKVVNFSPYKIHQRLAPSMRVGRFCLAADAAHRKYSHPTLDFRMVMATQGVSKRNEASTTST